MDEVDLMVIMPDEQPPARVYPATVEEMGWGPYLVALADRLDSRLIDVVGQASKKDIRTAAKVLKTLGELEGVTQYLDSLTHD